MCLGVMVFLRRCSCGGEADSSRCVKLWRLMRSAGPSASLRSARDDNHMFNDRGCREHGDLLGDGELDGGGSVDALAWLGILVGDASDGLDGRDGLG